MYEEEQEWERKQKQWQHDPLLKHYMNIPQKYIPAIVEPKAKGRFLTEEDMDEWRRDYYIPWREDERQRPLPHIVVDTGHNLTLDGKPTSQPLPKDWWKVWGAKPLSDEEGNKAWILGSE